MASLYLQDRSITVDKMGFRPVQWCSALSLTPDHGAALSVRDNRCPVLRLADCTSPQPRGYCVLPVPASRSSTPCAAAGRTDAVTGTAAWIVGHASLPVGTALPTTSSNLSNLTTPVATTADSVTATEVAVGLSGNPGSPVLISVIRDGTNLGDAASGPVDVLAVEVVETPP